jgi:putative membrane protein
MTHTPFRALAAACAAAVGLTVAATAEDRTRPAVKAVTDAEFVTKAASGGLFEVKSSELALRKATKGECKHFAEMMIKDHSKANDELKAAAAKAGIPLPTDLAPHHQKMLDSLKTATDFDSAYVDSQVKAHVEAVDLFTAASASVKDPGLRDFATKTLPVVKMHLEHVKKHAK